MTHSTQREKRENNNEIYIEYVLIRSQIHSTQRGRKRKEKNNN